MKRILWESYFDDSLTRKMGRRVRKGFPKDKLTVFLDSLSISYSVSEARYPRIPSRLVKRLEVEWDGSKEELIKKIEEKAFSAP